MNVQNKIIGTYLKDKQNDEKQADGIKLKITETKFNEMKQEERKIKEKIKNKTKIGQ